MADKTDDRFETASIRRAACSCGQLNVECEGEPIRVSVCHCLACQRRSGSVFAAQARFPANRVSVIGESRQWHRMGDEGGESLYSFCPDCGGTVFYVNARQPGLVAVAIGAFSDPGFPTPSSSFYERYKHGWIDLAGVIDRRE